MCWARFAAIHGNNSLGMARGTSLSGVRSTDTAFSIYSAVLVDRLVWGSGWSPSVTFFLCLQIPCHLVIIRSRQKPTLSRCEMFPKEDGSQHLHELLSSPISLPSSSVPTATLPLYNSFLLSCTLLNTCQT